MNCLDKMYKEIESILEREKKELEEKALNKTTKIKTFSSFTSEPRKERDFIAETIIPQDAVKKYLAPNREKEFVLFVFKKFFVFNGKSFTEEEKNAFISGVQSSLNSEEAIAVLKKKVLELYNKSNVGEGTFTDYFTSPYHALYHDDEGYYAVIIGNKFSNIPRPQAYLPNQCKKFVKESMDLYVEEFKDSLRNEKEISTFLNQIKSYINKSEEGVEELQITCEKKLFEFLKAHGVKEARFNAVVENLKLHLFMQGKFYFRKGVYEEYQEYKKVEFRY